MKKNKYICIVLAPLLILNIFFWITAHNLSQPEFLEVTFFDVGQGDAIFIKTPQNHQILIDGGPDDTILEKLNDEMSFYDRTIDLIILTHPEHDHIAGLLEVLKRYKVENILWTGILRDTSEFNEWQRLIKEERSREGANLRIARAGQKISTRTVLVEILYPFERLENKTAKNTNNTSVVLRLVFGENSFLFTGDVYKSVERKLLKKGIELKSNVLKVGHHGSKTSTAEDFIAEVLPEIAVISAGQNNSYGHPRQETLDTLENYGINIFRTDINGDVKIFSNREKIKLKTQI